MSDTHDFILEAPDDKMCEENIQLVSDTNHFNSKALWQTRSTTAKCSWKALTILITTNRKRDRINVRHIIYIRFFILNMENAE